MRSSVRGFTLIELTLVLVVAAILLAAAAPTLGGSLRAARLRASASGLYALCERARGLAAVEGRRYAVEVDPDAGEARLLVEPDPLAEPFDLAPVGGDAATLAFDEGVTLEAARVAGAAWDGAAPLRVAFEPDGSADEATLVLLGEDGDRAMVSVRALTGRPSVGEATEEDALAAAAR